MMMATSRVGRRLLSATIPTLFLGVLPLAHGCVSAQDQDPRIARVERGISGSLQVQGKAAEYFTILERLEHYDVPGVSVAVLDSGRIAWARGYGVKDVTTGEPVLPETLFQAASISKPLTAMAALKLVEEGLLDLDAPVNQYLKSWRLPENGFTEEQPVTLRHLLTHTGGTTVHGFPGYAVGDPVATTTEVLDGSAPANTLPVRVDTIPGSLWRYSGGGYTIVQQLLVDVTGKPFPELMRELVLEPAAMPMSSYAQPLPSGRESYAATAHLSDGTPVEGKWHIYPEMAAAGLWTNPTELAQLARDVQGSYRGEAGRILSPEMTRAQLTQGMGGYGLGFGVQGEGPSAQFSHGGSNHGFKAQFLAFMEGGRGVFIMTNGDQGAALAQEIALAVAREYGWPAPSYQEVILAEIPSAVLNQIAGTYRIENSGPELSVMVDGDHLRLEVRAPERVGETQVLKIYPTAENFFIDLTDGRRFRADRDDKGTVTAIQILGGPRAERAPGGAGRGEPLDVHLYSQAHMLQGVDDVRDMVPAPGLDLEHDLHVPHGDVGETPAVVDAQDVGPHVSHHPRKPGQRSGPVPDLDDEMGHPAVPHQPPFYDPGDHVHVNVPAA